jgi:hypothetical protein
MKKLENDRKMFSRRDFLKGASLITGAGLLAGCAPKAAETPNPEETEAAAPGMSAEDWLGVEPVIDEIAETIESDVIVIGAGTGGAYAAASCLEKGLKVIILEKNAVPATVRNDFGALGSKWQVEEGVEIDKAAVLHYHAMYSANRLDLRLPQIWANESADAVNWFGELVESRGAGDFVYEGGYEPDFSPTTYAKFPTGHSVIWNEEMSGAKMMQEYIEEMGGEFRFETPFVKFEYEGKQVTAAIAKDSEGKYIRFTGRKGIILSTGGYQQNPTMLKALQPQTVLTMTPPAEGPTYGDGIKACLWMGAQMDETHASMLFDRMGLLPNETPANMTRPTLFWLGSQPWLKVNLKGERFANESVPYDFILHASASQPGKCYCCIMDSTYFDQVLQFSTVGCSRVFPFANGSPNDTTGTDMRNTGTDIDVIRTKWGETWNSLMESGHLQQADTLEELAEKLNIPADTFVATVERYNELADKGVDEDFFKDSYRLLALKAPPYYGIRNTGMMLSTMDGIKIDTQMRPLDDNCVPFEGLRVIGDSSGSYFANTYPSLFTGYANGRTLTFARRVARILADEPVEL